MPDDEHGEPPPDHGPSMREKWEAVDDVAVEVAVEMIEVETPADPGAAPRTRVIRALPAGLPDPPDPPDPPVAEEVGIHSLPLKQGFRALDMFLVTGIFLVVGIAPMFVTPILFRFIYATTAGLIFGITRERSNTIFPCIVQHAAINLIAVFFASMQHAEF